MTASGFPDITPELRATMPKLRGRLLANESLAPLTWFRVGGPAQVLFTPADEDDLAYFLKHLPRELPVYVVGVGSNLIVRDGGISGVVIRLSPRAFGEVSAEGDSVVAGTAALDKRVAEAAASANIGGLEFYFGIPGTIGGALRMNAGAYGTQIGSYVTEVKVYRSAPRKIEILRGDQISFEYRHTSFAPDDMMLAVTLSLPSKPYKEILQGIRICNEKRRASQPMGQKSAGCIFKNPPGASAGRMIDELGLKGLSVGDARVSDRHANFFINAGRASAHDMLTLITDVRERVEKTYGIRLENEVMVWSA